MKVPSAPLRRSRGLKSCEPFQARLWPRAERVGQELGQARPCRVIVAIVLASLYAYGVV